MKKKHILFILNNAPDYREIFLQKLSEFTNLTVYAFPNNNGLFDPLSRGNYLYKEFLYFKFLNIIFVYTPLRFKDLKNSDYIFASLNLRNPVILVQLIFFNFFYKGKIIWWGQIFGQNDNFLVLKLKYFLLNKFSKFTLVYNDQIKQKLSLHYSGKVVSFNNTHVDKNKIYKQSFISTKNNLNFIFIGRFQKRKNLERLLTIFNNSKGFNFRIIGPGNEAYFGFKKIENDSLNTFEIFDKTEGEILKEHLNWAHLCINPGHLGLFAMTAAQYGIGLIIDKSSSHAPEVILPIKANQIFLNFSNISEVIIELSKLINNESIIKELGLRLQEELITNFTIENMVDKHINLINYKK